MTEPNEQESALKPCFICGEPVSTINSNTWKGLFVHCKRCVHTFAINPELWNSTWAHKQIAEKDRRIKELEENGPLVCQDIENDKLKARIAQLEQLASKLAGALEFKSPAESQAWAIPTAQELEIIKKTLSVNNAWESFRSSLSVHEREQARNLKDLAEQLLAERDQAIRKKNAYREVAQNKVAAMDRMRGPRPFTAYDEDAFYNEVDATAKRLMEQEK